MSIASEITRLQTAKANIKSAITEKGGTVLSTDTLSQYADCIRSIPTGGSASGEYIWEVYDGNITTYSEESVTLPLSSIASVGAYTDYILAMTTNMPFNNMGKFYMSPIHSLTKIGQAEEVTWSATKLLGVCLLRKDGKQTITTASADGNTVTIRTVNGNLIGYVAGDSATSYTSGWNEAEGKYYRPLFDDAYSDKIDLNYTVGTGRLVVDSLRGAFDLKSIHIFSSTKIATGTIDVTESSPSSTGNLIINNIKHGDTVFTPTSFVMFIVGTGSTNSVTTVAAINSSTATYTRTTSGVATSSPGTKSITYGSGTVTVPQYNSTYNFKVGTWRWVAWSG